jgi:MATE family multidrug resistance protein
MTALEIPRRGLRRLVPLLPRGVDTAEASAMARLAMPVAGLALVNMAMSVTDTLMTAAFGPRALAAVAVASDFYSIVFYLAAGCVGGLAPLYAAAHAAGDTGKGDPGKLARLRTAGWMVTLALALPLAVIVWNAPPLLKALSIDPGLVDLGRGYTHAMALTLVPMLAVGVLRTRLTAIERPGVMLKITVAAVPMNALLNLVLMHGVFGIPGLGVTGAGVASLLVAIFILLACMIETRRLCDSGLGRPDARSVIEIFRIGLPIAIATVAEVGVYLGATLYAATLSVADAAGHALAIRVAGITYAVYAGLGQAALVRIARAECTPHRKPEIMNTALLMGLGAGFFLMLVLAVAADPLAFGLLGVSDHSAAGIAAILLLLLAVSDLFGPGGAAAGGLLRGLKDTRPVMLFSLLGNWLIAAPFALVLTRSVEFGAIGIWIALTTGTVVSSLLTMLRLRRHSLRE